MLLTLCGFALTPRFLIDSVERLPNGDFDQELDGWQWSPGSQPTVADGTLTLSAGTRGTRPQVWQNFPPPEAGTHYRFSAELATQDLLPGAQDWEKARFMLFRPQGEKINAGPIQIGSLALDRDWQTVARVVSFGEAVGRLRVTLEIVHASGTFQARNLSIREAFTNPVYPPIYYSLLTLWILYASGLALCAYRFRHAIAFPRLLWPLAFLVGLGLVMPGSAKLALISALNAVVPFTFDAITQAMGRPITQIHYLTEWLSAERVGHFVLFGLLAVLLRLSLPSAGRQQFLLLLLLICLGTEVLQFFAPGRSPTLADAAVDLAGMMLALALMKAFYRSRARASS